MHAQKAWLFENRAGGNIATIEELHPYNAWQLRTIHVQKMHGYERLLLGSVIFYHTPYIH